MLFHQSCSWCSESNDVSGGPTYCRNCGHRADVPRLECTCPKCSLAGTDWPPPGADRPRGHDRHRPGVVTSPADFV
jgi:hypothetical protein